LPGRSCRVALATSLLLIGGSAHGEEQRATASPGQVVVRVVQAGDHAPIAFAVVTLSHLDTKTVRRMATDTSGRTAFTSVDLGRYRLRVTASGFLNWGDSGVDAFTSTAFELTAASVHRSLSVRLVPMSSISGSVLTTDGAPVPDVVVHAIEVGASVSDGPPMPSSRAVTDDLGRFAIAELKPGSYIVGVGARELGDTMTGRIGVPASFYPGAVLVEDAEKIPLDPGEHRLAVTVQTHLTTFHTVQGQIVGGQPIGGAAVWIAPSSDLISDEAIYSTTAGPDGAFKFPAVAAGSYLIKVWSRSPAASASQEISVDAESTAQPIVISAVPHDAISGTVGAAPLTGAARRSLRVMIDPVGVGLARWSAMRQNASADVTGKFQLSGLLPGRYRVSVIGIDAAVQSVTIDGRAYRGHEVDVDELVSTMDISLTTDVGRILGTSAGNDGVTHVALFPEASALWSLADRGSSLFRLALVGPEGEFRFSQVLPGEYIVAGLDPSALSGWRRPAVLGTLAAGGVRVIVNGRKDYPVQLRRGR